MVSRAYGVGEQDDCGTFTSSMIDIDDDFRAYPNPVRDVIHLDSKLDFDEIRVYSQSGRLIVVSKNIDKVDTSSLVLGSYFVVMSTNGIRIDGFTFIKI